MRKRTTRDVFVVQGAYGQGWEDVTQEDARKEARMRLLEYSENEPQYPHRLITRRERVTVEASRGAPCTGGNAHSPIYDRHGERIHVGDKLRVQHCVGRYGQTKVEEMTVTEAHWTYCQHGVAGTEYDFAANVLRCKHTHHDFEHGHDTWAEIIK
jgi:hypothetical protein